MSSAVADGVGIVRQSCDPSAPNVPMPCFAGSAGTMGDANGSSGDANTEAVKLLGECQARNIILQVHGGQLDIDAPVGELTEELLQRLLDCKAELLAMLQPQAGDGSPDDRGNGRDAWRSDSPAVRPASRAGQRPALRRWPPAVPDSIIADPMPTCSNCGQRAVVPGQPGRPAGLCFSCWGKRR